MNTRDASHISSKWKLEDLGILHSTQADRVMICGSLEMLDTQEVIEKCGMFRGTNARPGVYVWEKAFTG